MIETDERLECFKIRFEILKQEIDNLQNGIANYDKFLTTIKSWAITVFSGLVALSTQVSSPRNEYFLLVALPITMMFWVLDGYFKGIQRVYTERYNLIEKYLSSSEFERAIQDKSWGAFRFPDIGSGFHVSNFEKWRRSMEAAFLFNTYLLYLLMFLLGLALLIVYWVS